MKSVSKLLVVLVLFTIVFVLLRMYGSYFDYRIDTLIANLGGLTYLYSTVGTLFAVFAGFVVVSESQDWNTLVKASKNELQELHEMWLWSQHFPAELREEFQKTIELYLDAVTTREWHELSKGTESKVCEPILASFHDLIAEAVATNQSLSREVLRNFTDFLKYRNDRLEYSYEPLPFILKLTVLLVDSALIILSFFIGVQDPWLDYLFMLCVVALGTVVYVVIDDLDNPLRPGEWQLTSNGYRELLEKIRA